MKKLISALLAFTLATIILMAGSTAVLAAPPIDTEKESSLTLVYRFGEKYFEGLEIKTYRIADAYEDGTYELCAPFDSLPVSIHGITTKDEWSVVTSTLSSFAKGDKIVPSCTALTDEKGTVKFESLKPGMYLTLAVKIETEEEVTKFENFITVIPQDDAVSGHNYDVCAYPKCESFKTSKDEVTYKIIKQWCDNGYTDKRPASVDVDILRDGELYAEIKLTKDNNWSYTWTAPNDGTEWQAVERNVPEKYTVTVSNKAKTIIITNTYADLDSDAPQTGDTFVLWPYLVIIGLCGGVIVIIAVWRKRNEK